MTVRQQISEALAPLVDAVFPPRCPLCGEAIAAQTGLCANCWSELQIPGDPNCSLCQRPFVDGRHPDGAICAPCMGDPPKHDGIASGTIYNDASRKLILSFKHGRRIALAPMLARLIEGRLPELEGNWLAIPVPLHRKRLWMRGFNQAALLASELSKRRGMGLLVDGLVRVKSTPTLGGLGKTARSKALSGAIRVAPRHRTQIKGARLVLVDDVLTSGATSNACVSALKRAGAERVIVACFARVLSEIVHPEASQENETPEV